MKFTINDLANTDDATKYGELKEVIQEESGEASAAQ